MFHVELAPLGGILGPLKSDLGVFWAKIPLYPYNVKFSKSIFSKSAHLPILSFWILNLHIIICQFQKRSTVKHFFCLSPYSCHMCCDDVNHFDFILAISWLSHTLSVWGELVHIQLSLLEYRLFLRLLPTQKGFNHGYLNSGLGQTGKGRHEQKRTNSHLLAPPLLNYFSDNNP